MPPTEAAVRVANLRKIYTVPEREPGAKAAIRSLVRRRTRDIPAVDNISFQVQPGEIVGFLGPNGAGKTTTLKMLSGLLHPSSGDVSVLGFTPANRDKSLLRQITLVMGQRSQLSWDIPALDSFELNKAIYDIPTPGYVQMRNELIDLLDLGALVRKPVRTLSLGERMKCEIAIALLHRPRILFLDEPTLGLDVTMQRRIRSFIGDYNRRYEGTVLLTSHYMADVEALCERVIVIHRGTLLFDGALGDLVHRFAPHKTIIVDLDDFTGNLWKYGDVVSADNGRYTLRVRKEDAARLTAQILADLPVVDLTVEEPPIEDVIEQVFARESP